MQVKFEYLFFETQMFDRKLRTLEQEVNGFGEEGWELVATCGVHNQTFVFMRTTAPVKKPRAKAEA
jgi:hypothetical protein